MRAYVSRLVLLLMLLGSMLLIGAGPVAAHCVQTSAGLVDLSPGHLAAAFGHTTGIANSEILLAVCPNPDSDFPFVNAPAPTGGTTSPH
jgi:hypothetical protein